MVENEQLRTLKQHVIETGCFLLGRSLVEGTCGNISARLAGSDIMVVTPSGIPYPDLAPSDLVTLRITTGEQLEGVRRPSVETPVHLRVMRDRPDISAAIHTHSIFASAVAAAHLEIPVFLTSMAHMLGGRLELAEYAGPGSEELQRVVSRKLQTSDAVLLANCQATCRLALARVW